MPIIFLYCLILLCSVYFSVFPEWVTNFLMTEIVSSLTPTTVLSTVFIVSLCKINICQIFLMPSLAEWFYISINTIENIRTWNLYSSNWVNRFCFLYKDYKSQLVSWQMLFTVFSFASWKCGGALKKIEWSAINFHGLLSWALFVYIMVKNPSSLSSRVYFEILEKISMIN